LGRSFTDSPLTLASPRTSAVRENGLLSQPSPPEEEREMRSHCLARAINRSLLTEFAAVRGVQSAKFHFGEISLPEGRGNQLRRLKVISWEPKPAALFPLRSRGEGQGEGWNAHPNTKNAVP